MTSAVRTTMAQLIDHTRSLIGDPASQTQRYTDLQIQQRLDLRRHDHPYIRLQEQDDIAPGGGILWKTFWGDPYWESDATLRNNSYTTITADDVDFFIGRWTFNVARTDIPIYAVGKTYDVYMTAVDLLTDWLATMTEVVDFTAGSQSFSRSQGFKQMQNMIDTYRRKAGRGKTVVPINRTDIRIQGQPPLSMYQGWGGRP